MWGGLVSCRHGSSAAQGRRRTAWAALVFSQAWRPAGVSERRAADSFLMPDKRPSEMSLTCFLSPLPGLTLPNKYSARPRHRTCAPSDATKWVGQVASTRLSLFVALYFICTQTRAGLSWSDMFKSLGCVSLIHNCCAISSFLRRGRSHQR